MLSKVIDSAKRGINKRGKISVKLTILYALMFSLVLLVLNASVLYGIKYYLYNQATTQIEDIKTILLTNIGAQNYNVDVSTEPSISVGIFQNDGTQLDSSGNFNYSIPHSGPYDEIMHLEQGEKHLEYKNLEAVSKDYGTVYIQIVKDMRSEYVFMEILFLFMAAADFIGIISSVIIGFIVSKRMLTPIDNITKAAENISINNLKERIDVTGPDDELRRLGDTFNKMIDGLQDAFGRQVQFVSDASHELRTPIAVIQGYANLLDRWGKDDREALEKSINGIKLEADNMAGLVEKLLFLAKGDTANLNVEKKKFMLNALIDEVVQETRLIDSKHTISSVKNDIVAIFADYALIKQMIRIFVENSIKFAPEQSKIDISSEIQGNKVKLTVSDTGIGIPEADIGKIFDRFYTADKSRSKGLTGTGLGLSIARRIAYIHQGEIKVESEEGKYTKIIVTLNSDQ
jgi:two-component system, OmpR family, sensor histidine kinase ArlS